MRIYDTCEKKDHHSKTMLGDLETQVKIPMKFSSVEQNEYGWSLKPGDPSLQVL